MTAGIPANVVLNWPLFEAFLALLDRPYLPVGSDALGLIVGRDVVQAQRLHPELEQVPIEFLRPWQVEPKRELAVLQGSEIRWQVAQLLADRCDAIEEELLAWAEANEGVPHLGPLNEARQRAGNRPTTWAEVLERAEIRARLDAELADL